MNEGDRLCIEIYGFTWDYFNEYPHKEPSHCSADTWDKYFQRYARGELKTYSERYARDTEILSTSDPLIVTALDDLALRIISAAKKHDQQTVKTLVTNVLAYRRGKVTVAEL